MKVLTLKLSLLSLALISGTATSHAVKPQPTAAFGDPFRAEISHTLRKITKAVQVIKSESLGIVSTMQVAVMTSELNHLLLLSEQFYDFTVAHRDYAESSPRLSQEQVGIHGLKHSAQYYSEWAIEVFKALVEIETSLPPKYHTVLHGVLQQINANAQHLSHNPYLNATLLANSWRQFFIERHVSAYDKGELEANTRAALAALATTVADKEISWDTRLEQVLEQTSTFIANAKQLHRINNIKTEREPQADHPQHYQQYATQILTELQRIETTLLATDGMQATQQLWQYAWQEARLAVTGEQRDQPLRSFNQLLNDLEQVHENFLEMKENQKPQMEESKHPLSDLSAAEHFSGGSS